MISSQFLQRSAGVIVSRGGPNGHHAFASALVSVQEQRRWKTLCRGHVLGNTSDKSCIVSSSIGGSFGVYQRRIVDCSGAVGGSQPVWSRASLFASGGRKGSTGHKVLSIQRMGLFHSKIEADGHGEEEDVWLVVGLGNPGPKYEKNKHNVGFMAIDEIVKQKEHDSETIQFRLQKNCHVGRTRILGKKVVLAKPMTFMNTSGEGVSKLARYYKVPVDRIIVLYDDLDTGLGSVKLKRKGGHGGQNGLKSIIEKLSSNEFPRIKIGIGRPKPGVDVVTHVLSDFYGEERDIVHSALGESLDILRSVLQLGIEKASSGVRVDANGDVIKPKHQNGKAGTKRKKESLAAAIDEDSTVDAFRS